MAEIAAAGSVAGNAMKTIRQNYAGVELPDPQAQYVKRLCVAKCECGSMDYQYLNLPKDHGVYYQDYDHPLMNANDHVGKKHVMHFGRCNSETNPKNIASDVLSKAVPILGVLDYVKSDLLKCDGCKCSPRTLRSWEEVNKANRLDGAPAVVNSSQLVCAYGGIITITEEDTGDADQTEDQTEEDTPEEEDILDTLPSNMADTIRNMNSDAEAAAAAAAEAAAEWYAENADSFAQDFGCTPEMSAANYSSNSTQMISGDCMNDAGYISDYSGLSNFNIAGTNAGAIGAGCAAAFNVLQALGSPLGMAEIIGCMEMQQTARGFMDGGPMAVSMCGLAGLFGNLGLKAELSFPTKMTADSLMLEEGEVAVLGASKCARKAGGILSESIPSRHVVSSRELAQKFDSKRAATSIGGRVIGKAIINDGFMESKIERKTESKAAIASGREQAKVKKASAKPAKMREESFCTITRGKDGLMCAEMPNRPIHEVLQEKSGGSTMLMKVKK